MNKEELLQSLLQQTYIPVLISTDTTREHPKPKMPIATTTTPTQVCGAAKLVGYTSTGNTMPSLFIVSRRKQVIEIIK